MDKILRLGYAPTRRFTFSKEDAHKYKELTMQKISQIAKDIGNVEIVDLEGINDEGLLFDTDSDVPKIVKKFKDSNVDAVFFPHCNFGTEDTVAKVAKAIGKPVLLWGPRDEAPLENGMRLRDTQCGLFATGKILRRFNVPFTYIVNSRVDSKVFERGFRNFLAVANVVKTFSNLRILQISTRPESFWTMIYNEGELLEKFGIQITPITLEDIRLKMEEVLENNDNKLQDAANDIKDKVDCSATTDEAINKVAALKVTMKDFIVEKGCSGAAIQCWDALQRSMGIMPCLANSLLTDEGYPVTCETDIHGAITSVMAQAATFNKNAPFFADLTIRHPENDNSELLFHCGNFPVSLACDSCNPKFDNHFLFDDHSPGTVETEIKGGDMTILRFDGDHNDYKLLLGKAKGTTGPYTRGTYVWVEVNDWPKWEHKLVTGPYVHHSVGIHADIVPVLYEACKYIPGLEPDMVDPTKEQVQSWLLGHDY